ncbi:MAG: hypothetical protein IJX70_01420, partial [Clostridia bacterium]|nr:hypothetical protein [Clostridia bacterium]
RLAQRRQLCSMIISRFTPIANKIVANFALKDFSGESRLCLEWRQNSGCLLVAYGILRGMCALGADIDIINLCIETANKHLAKSTSFSYNSSNLSMEE